jgi:protein-S-isoprenylcysteine O-methyltransferase Ste14
MNEHLERPNRLPWPPIILATGWMLATAAHYLAPLPWLTGPLGELVFAFGVLIGVGAIAIDVAAIRSMRQARTTIMPHKGSDHLVTRGPFSFTRNPIYLANAMLTIAIGLVTGIAWFLPAAFIASFATQKLAIEREEKHLEARFGKTFRDYAKRVRRWI